ncbi:MULTISPECIES: hypothetical protein [Photorhabdus]
MLGWERNTITQKLKEPGLE